MEYTYEEMLEDLYGKVYDIETPLLKRGFECSFDGDNRTTYMNGNLSVSIHWVGDIITETGLYNGFSIWRLSKSEQDYVGPRPENDEELDDLLKKSGFPDRN